MGKPDPSAGHMKGIGLVERLGRRFSPSQVFSFGVPRLGRTGGLGSRVDTEPEPEFQRISVSGSDRTKVCPHL